MRYESEILYDLMKRDGLLNPPQNNLPYESELKEKYVNDAEGAYPKLQDYRSEWLNYTLEGGIGEFPYVTLTDVTNATIHNVVPYAYQSAILKGQTLVNILDYEKSIFDSKTFINDEKIITHESTTSYGKIYLPPTHPLSGEKILIKVDVISNSLNETFYLNKDWSNESYVTETLSIPVGFVGDKIFIVTPEKKDTSKYLLRGETGNRATGIIKFKVSAMVYQKGMENWDIPYFDGMQSVQMPVLTTTGKNLYNKEIHQLPSIMGADSKLFYATDYIPVLPNTTYTKSNGTRLELCDSNKVSIGGASATTFTTSSDTYYIRYNVLKSEIDTHQLEQGSTATSYEPYKSIISSTPSDLELRGYGKVLDTLDLKTGELTQCIAEYTITGNENWVSNTETNCQRFNFTRADILEDDSINIYWVYVQSEKLNGVMWRDSWTTTNTISMKNGRIYMHFPLGTTMEQAKALMVGSKIQYAIKPTIKTVDLMVTNQNGESLYKISPIEGTMHLTTSSDTIPPLFSGEIPVEAIEQNLASFTDLEGVEHDG